MPSPDTLAAFALGACLAVTLGTATRAEAAAEEDVGRDLARLGQRRILFAHQSVGADILRGLERLAAGAAATVRVVEVKGPGDLTPGTLGHSYVSRNGDPDSKLASFERALEAAGAPPDIALLKFCYVDIRADTEAGSLFARYEEAMRRLRERYPRTTFVHVTVPLTVVQRGPKAWAKRLLGRPIGLVENARREEFNARLRAAYEGKEPLFDLARIESTHPDGNLERERWGGRDVPALVPAYTHDGGHLNERGQDLLARGLLAALASLPEDGRP